METFESREHEALIREILGGRLANTACVVFAPDGETKLTRAGRTPKMVFGRNDEDVVLDGLKEIANKYELKGDIRDTVVQDFHSFRQALNVAASDQRLLCFVVAAKKDCDELRQSLRLVFAAPEMIGRFHVDFGSKDVDSNWSELLSEKSPRAGIYLIAADEFGQSGKVVGFLPLDASNGLIQEEFLKLNLEYSRKEQRKSYRDHVNQGLREGVFFENAVPYGEDRDGDGEIDPLNKQRPNRR